MAYNDLIQITMFISLTSWFPKNQCSALRAFCFVNHKNKIYGGIPQATVILYSYFDGLQALLDLNKRS